MTFDDKTITNNGKTTAVISADDPNPIVTFTNTKEKKNWLDGSAGVTNNFFGTGSETTHGGGPQ